MFDFDSLGNTETSSARIQEEIRVLPVVTPSEFSGEPKESTHRRVTFCEKIVFSYSCHSLMLATRL